MRGCWLSKSKAALATGLTAHDFTKNYGVTLKQRHEGKWPEYFLPEDKMTETAKINLADLMEDYDPDVADIVENILGDVSGNDFAVTMEDKLNEAKLSNIQARTKWLGEKLERRKQELFSEWSEAFYSAFSEAFSKFKNGLIELQLEAEQLKTLQEKLDLALQSLKDKLAYIEQEYDKEEMEDDILK